MKNAKFSDAQILAILRQAENGVSVCELCCEHGMSSASFYKWRVKFGGMYAEMSMQNDLLNFAGVRHAFERAEKTLGKKR